MDTNYIQKLDVKGRVNFGLRYEDMEVRFFSGSNETFVFRNTGIGFSFGGRLGKVSLSLTLPITDLNTSDANAGSNIGLNLRFYQPRYYYEIRGQRLTGFNSQNSTANFRKDLQLWDITLIGFKIYNPLFSLRAAFKTKERQKISQGSVLSALTLNTQYLTADSLDLSTSEENSFLIKQFRQFEVGIMVGYAYTFVFADNWFFTPVLLVGPEFRLLTYDRLAQNRTEASFRIGPRLRGRFAFGYDTNAFFFTINGFFLPGFATQNKLNTRVQDNEIRMRFGFRF